MLDIKVIRQDPERVKAAMKSRNKDMDKEIDEILEIDVERRAINAAVDNMKAEQNRVSKLIPQYKKEGKDVAPILAEMKELSDKITEDGAKLAELEEMPSPISPTRACRSVRTTPRMWSCAAGASRPTLTMSRRPTGTWVLIWASWTRRLPPR